MSAVYSVTHITQALVPKAARLPVTTSQEPIDSALIQLGRHFRQVSRSIGRKHAVQACYVKTLRLPFGECWIACPARVSTCSAAMPAARRVCRSSRATSTKTCVCHGSRYTDPRQL